MKPITRNAYAQRIDRVIARLQQAIERQEALPDLAEFAEVAHLSLFHFHRVYRALTGETIGRTVARLRLLRALHLLADTPLGMADIAQRVGYETSQSFARAVREAFDASPSELRLQPDRMAQERQRLSTPLLTASGDTAPLRVEVVSVDPFEVVALRNRGDYADLDGVYSSMFAWAAESGLIEQMTGLYGIPLGDHRDVPPDQLEFDCALQFSVAAKPSLPMRLLQLGGGRYARTRHVGSFAGLEDTTDRVLAAWLPESGYGLRDEPVHYCYNDDPEQVPEALLRTDIFIPLGDEVVR